MHISEFYYQLPPELIAQEPLKRRDASRLLVLDRTKQTWFDEQFTALPNYLRPNDLLVINNTRVFPARLVGERDPSGGRVEVLLVRELEPRLWEALVRPGHRLKCGARMRFGKAQLGAEVVAVLDEGLRVLRFVCDESFETVLDELGQTPLPPYIKRPTGSTPADRERYQTVYAAAPGAIAAPTAGLHFTPCVMDEVLARGARFAEITLHVGYGTFEPVRVENIEGHKVAAERFAISEVAAQMINDTRANGGRVIAIGTTTTRALESAVNAKGEIEAGGRFAGLTITAGYPFRVADALLTNFHLPSSSLLLLVCAFAGRGFVLDAYHHAVEARYRFYSYGDCMLII
jgi:S-adenosylmethionine:tRNA ribosyltransferase-isomerase